MFLEFQMFQTNVVEEIKTHILRSIKFFEIRAVYEIMWKNTVQPGLLQATIRRKRSVFWIPKDTDTQSLYVILLSRYTNVCTNAPQHYVIRTPSVLFPHHLINRMI
jgi:hypothetical protein